MKKRFLISSVAGIAAVALLGAGVASADLLSFKRGKKNTAKKNTFSMSTVYTGGVRGEMMINGKKILITPTTTIYDTEKGLQAKAVSVNKQPIYVSGNIVDGRMVASMVIVQPAKSKSKRGDKRASKPNRVQSDSNPDVGEIAEDESY